MQPSDQVGTVKSSSLGLSEMRGAKSERQSYRDNGEERGAEWKYGVMQSEVEEWAED